MVRPSFRFSTARIAGWSARHPWIVLSIWAVLLALAAFAAKDIGHVLTADEMKITSAPESVRGETLLNNELRGPRVDTESIIVRSSVYRVEDPEFAAQVEMLSKALRARPDVAASVVSYFEIRQAGSPAPQALVSKDGHSALIAVTLASGNEPADARLAALAGILNANRAEGFDVLSIGSGSVGQTLRETAEKDLRNIELFGLPVTLLVLIGIFGALVAAGVSMVLAGVAIVVAIGATALVGRFFDLSFFVVNMISMIGMAVGIDYALFITERYREERKAGASVYDAIYIAGDTASKAVLFSGITVILALLGLFIVPITTFRSLGLGALMVVSAAITAMLTLVPALLRLLGDRIDWPRRRPATQAKARPGAGIFSGFWDKLTRRVIARPIISAVVVGVLLLAATVPYFWLERGPSGAEALPQGQTRTAYAVLSTEFSPGLLDPVEIAVDGERQPSVEEAITQLRTMLAQESVFVPISQVVWNPEGTVAEIQIPLAVGPDTPEARSAVQHLRSELIPKAFAGVPAAVLVTGSTAFDLDSVQLIDKYTPGVFVFVLGLSFTLLLLVFRSIVVPLKAILMNLLSVGASYGILVLVFQGGLGQRLFGLEHARTIEAWVPIFLFCVLFGLSMDYHVFLLSRIREHFDETKKNAESVLVGLRKTGRIITGAALIMVVVFASFASGRLVMMQQMGVGLAIAVALDATLVRFVLVSATMALLGRVNWYLPSWLRWLPRISVEGKRRP